MMNLFRQNNTGRVFLLVATGAAVAFVATGFGRAELRSAASQVYRGVSFVRAHITVGSYVVSRAALLERNKELSAELAAYRSRELAYRVAQEENLWLKDALRYTRPDSVVAPVVSTMSASPYSTFLIDTQTKTIRTGDMVAASGFIIGSIIEVGPVSQARALFAPGARVSARVHGVPISLEGRGAGNARASAPREAPIVAGDIVYGIDVGNQPIGIVGAVESDPADADARILVRLPLTIDSIPLVTITPAP